MSVRLAACVLAATLSLPVAAARAELSDGIDPSILAPGLVQASEAIARLEKLTDEAEAIATAIFRVQNEFGERRLSLAGASPSCEMPWVNDLGERARELGRAFRDAVQSARVQAQRVEALTVQPTVRPLLDAETNHKVLDLLARVDDLSRSYPESASWHERYIEPSIRGCPLALVPTYGIPPAAASAATDEDAGAAARKPAPLVAILAFGGGFLCPGAVPAAGVMLVRGKVCYSESESCSCEPVEVDPATVLGPETNAGSAN
ncbi:MAG TPA: hypothetical protein VEC57_06470 [Candidatus Limnocylindrales bacterium]|nr:hypothetical protein [Candidatus Limnocylindrales bacterium]